MDKFIRNLKDGTDAEANKAIDRILGTLACSGKMHIEFIPVGKQMLRVIRYDSEETHIVFMCIAFLCLQALYPDLQNTGEVGFERFCVFAGIEDVLIPVTMAHVYCEKRGYVLGHTQPRYVICNKDVDMILCQNQHLILE